jgi:hypothetical protein
MDSLEKVQEVSDEIFVKEALINEAPEETPEARQEVPSEKPLAQANSCDPGSTWIIESGWSLSRIAALCWQDALYWRYLYEANILDDPNIVHPGDELVIPEIPPELAARIAKRTEEKKAAKHRPKQRRADSPTTPEQIDLQATEDPRVEDLSHFPGEEEG